MRCASILRSFSSWAFGTNIYLCRYEDLRALDGGIDGMETIEAILWLAAKRLRPGGCGVLWLEVDPSHPHLIQQYLSDNAPELQLKWVSCYQDIFHKDRFVEIVRV